MPTHWYTGIVSRITDLAPKTKSFSIEIPEVTAFNFKAGQFLTFDLPVGEKRLQRWRSYSIASAPDDTNVIELCIVHYDQGLGSSYFFNEVRVGTELKFKAAEGGFILPTTIDHDLVMICTGTGIAPFRSMVREIIQQHAAHKKIHLIFGTRTREDILYLDELQQWEDTMPGFKFDIALSRETRSPLPANYHKGYVHPVYKTRYHVVRPDVHFYICGWTRMIDEAVENLFGEMGYSREQIHFELYG